MESLTDRLLHGGDLTDEEAYALADALPQRREEIRAAARKVHAHFSPRQFDSCSIVNARSGRCGEDCKWCAQSAHHHTNCEEYPLIRHERCVALGQHNAALGIGRFSVVTSGRALSDADVNAVCSCFKELSAHHGVKLCASMGLLGYDALRRLKAAGMTRYHCNLETAPSHFPTLCSTHTIEQKLQTIEMARRAGLEICSGGIIGMGESMTQRVEFALTLRRAHPVSIPINILCPIPGTPLENAKPLSTNEILDTIALFRLIHPRAILRFAGGRNHLDRDAQRLALDLGINGAIVGDLLTTIGSQVAQDRALVTQAGYNF